MCVNSLCTIVLCLYFPYMKTGKQVKLPVLQKHHIKLFTFNRKVVGKFKFLCSNIKEQTVKIIKKKLKFSNEFKFTKFTIHFGCVRSTWPGNGRHWLSLEEKWPNYASGPKCAANSDSCWVRRLFNVCVIKMSFIWNFFCHDRHFL